MDAWDTPEFTGSVTEVTTQKFPEEKLKTPRKWTTERIIALVLLNFILVGIVLVSLAFAGVFDASPAPVPTPTTAAVLVNLPPPITKDAL